MNFINQQLFIKTIELIKKENKDNQQLSKHLNTFEPCDIINRLEYPIVKLLQHLTSDTSDWITYYMYELNFGKDYREGTVTFDGINIKLKTPKDLWKILQNKQQS